jgi:hypothetical protein
MGGVDKGDQFRSHFGGFASRSHFKKRYKKVHMAILDCMLLNALNMSNLLVDKVPLRRKMKRFEFLQLLANELLHYKTEGLMSPQTERNHQAPVAMERGAMIGNGHTIVMSMKTIRCIVCSLELSQLEQLEKKIKDKEGWYWRNDWQGHTTEYESKCPTVQNSELEHTIVYCPEKTRRTYIIYSRVKHAWTLSIHQQVRKSGA